MPFSWIYARFTGLLAALWTRIHGPQEPQQPREQDVHDRIRQCRSIVDFSFARRGEIDGNLDLGTRLALRARANRHLADALGIENSLTTADCVHHKLFLKRATTHLRKMATPSHWQELYCSAGDMLDSRLKDQGPTLLLGPLVRSLCLRVVLHVLFDGPSGLVEYNEGDIETVCTEINKQWMLSKNSVAGTKIPTSAALYDALTRLLQQQYQGQGQSPSVTTQDALELVLPAYEALWRVVLLTFVTICHRGKQGAGGKLPSTSVSTAAVHGVIGSGNGQEKEVLKIAKEGLRLFPSSKSIYRACSLSENDDAVVSADLSGLHRDQAIWGPDALQFRPRRFDDLTPRQKQAYIPFGLAPHLCPAYHGFGERMILLLVAVLQERLGSERASIQFNCVGLDIDNKAELPTGRNDMEEWIVELIE